MSKIPVPAPPLASLEENEGTSAATTRNQGAMPFQKVAPLDAEFLGRVYRFAPRFGTLLAICVAVISRSAALTLSFVAGFATGLLLLKTQEMLVRRVVRPKSWPAYDGPDKKIPVWAIVPGKYALIIAAILLMHRTELLNFVAFAGGCLVMQFVVLSMAWGRLKANRAGHRSLNEIYVQPHKVKNSPHA